MSKEIRGSGCARTTGGSREWGKWGEWWTKREANCACGSLGLVMAIEGISEEKEESMHLGEIIQKEGEVGVEFGTEEWEQFSSQ